VLAASPGAATNAAAASRCSDTPSAVLSGFDAAATAAATAAVVAGAGVGVAFADNNRGESIRDINLIDSNQTAFGDGVQVDSATLVALARDIRGGGGSSGGRGSGGVSGGGGRGLHSSTFQLEPFLTQIIPYAPPHTP
jgi:hypothetical protein